MVKKILSVVVAFLMLFCTIPLSVFADDVLSVCPKCGERTYVQKTGLTVDACGIGVTYNSKHCNSCRYSYYDWVLFGVAGYKEFDSSSGDSLPADFISEWIVKNFGKGAQFSQFQSGGGSASPGGVGRHPSGYVNDNGTPYIGSSGALYVAMEHDYIGFRSVFIKPFRCYCNHYNGDFSSSDILSPTYICRDDYMSLRVSSSSVKFYPDLEAGYKLVAPIDGYYSVVTCPQYSTICDSDIDQDFKYSGEFAVSLKNKLYAKDAVIKLNKEYSTHAHYNYNARESTFFRAIISGPVILKVEPLDPIYKQQTNITINNNTWNGNIYVDNSTNLTYIYPRYTTINENNETVTNISNNPIIYNQDTKQYYTYDQTTNNYYYITYNAPTPSPDPTPTPTPDPGGSGTTPTPTPAPTPGGSGGGSDSSGGGSGFNPFKWLADLLKDIVEGIFKAVWKLITSIFGFLIWLVSLLGKVLPFLPSEGLAALSAAAIIITVIRIIKFILGR